MRPETARRNINRAFSRVFKTGGPTVVDILPELRRNLPSLYKLREVYKRNEGDNRTGKETYGFDNIRGDLCYISDRWQCQFRVQWLIEVLEMDECELANRIKENNANRN